jgi:hypothetical protein
VLIVAGDQVPVTGVVLVEDVGNAGGVTPLHNGPIGLNVGVTGLGAVKVTVAVGIVKGMTQP